MDREIFLDELPLEFTSNFIGGGCNGKVYKLCNNKKFKLLNDPSFGSVNFEFLLGLNSENFVYPDSLVYVDGNLTGYISEYVDGVFIDDLGDFELNTIISSLKDLEEEIRNKSFDYIYLSDIHSGHLILNSFNKFKVIDTDFHCYDSSLEPFDLYKLNLVQYNDAVLHVFNNLILYDNEYLCKYFRMCVRDGKMTASGFLSLLSDYLYNEISFGVENLNDIKKGLSLIRKR